MARQKGRTYPSDHRRWFRVREDILDDPKLAEVSPEVFRFFFRLLAMLNRTKSRDGGIRLDRFALNSCAMREQRRHALRIARAGAEAELYSLREDGAYVVIHVGKWAETQELAPAHPQSSPTETPATTPTPTPTPTREDKEGAARAACVSKPPDLELAGEPERKRKRGRKRQPNRPCPDELTLDELARLQDWAERTRGSPISEARLRHAWERLKSWARAGDHWKSDWVMALQNGITAGWVFQGYAGQDGDRPPPPSKAQAREDRTKEAAREALRRHMAKARPPDPRALSVIRGGAHDG